MTYEDIVNELGNIRLYIIDNYSKMTQSEIYELYRRYVKLSMLISSNNPSFDEKKYMYYGGNCYCYALMMMTPSTFIEGYENGIRNDNSLPSTLCHNVGFLSDSKYSLKLSTLLKNLKNDLDFLGIEYYDTDFYSENKHGGYKISLYYKAMTDFHFIRQNIDKKWSHKLGYSETIDIVTPKYNVLGYTNVGTIEIVKPVIRELHK